MQFQDDRNIVTDDISAERWPLLEYAVRFWNQHLEKMVDAGINAEEIKLILQDWGVVKAWVRLWQYMHL